MSQADFWYIRFPDGRILRAASTTILRQELDAGHIPLGSTVRRSPSDEWVSLQWTQEFADLVEELSSRPPPAPPEPRSRRPVERREATNALGDNAATVSSRLDAARLHLVGVRGYLDELLAALDSTLTARKLLLGIVAGLFFGVLLAIRQAAWFERDSVWLASAWSLAIIAAVILDVLTALLTQLTYVELARLRPARWSEALDGIAGLTVRVIISQLIVRGLAWALIVLLRWLPYWLGPDGEEGGTLGQQIAAGNALALGMILEALIWPVFFFWWLLPPIFVVEGSSLVRGLRQWLVLLRQHLGRVFIYQALAVGLGLLLTAPFLLLIAPMFLPSFVPPEPLHEVASRTRFVLLGLACGPLLTYWIVANVFIYLNLRYGASARR
jgi:hypothetical protein